MFKDQRLFTIKLKIVCSSENNSYLLGRVDLWRLFLQQVMRFLYKAELIWCGYST